MSNGNETALDLTVKVFPMAAVLATGAAFLACWMFLYGYSVGYGENVAVFFSLTDVVGSNKHFFLASIIVIFPMVIAPALFSGESDVFIRFNHVPTPIVVIVRVLAVVVLLVIFYVTADRILEVKQVWIYIVVLVFVAAMWWLVAQRWVERFVVVFSIGVIVTPFVLGIWMGSSALFNPVVIMNFDEQNVECKDIFLLSTGVLCLRKDGGMRLVPTSELESLESPPRGASRP